MRTKVLLAALIALSACERPPLPLHLSGERLMVHAVLLAERDLVHVLVERVEPRSATDPNLHEGLVEIRPVSGADVRVTVGGEELQLTEAPEGAPPCASQFPYAVPQQEVIGPGCYVAPAPGGVSPGDRYELVVRIAGEVVAEGSAEVPAFPVLTTPVAGGHYEVVMGPIFDERPLPGIQVRYELDPAVAGILTSLRFDSVFTGGERASGAHCNYDSFGYPPEWREATVDSLAFVPRALTCYRQPPQGGQETFVPDSIFASLALAAFDSSYMRYDQAARQQSAELASLQAGVSGALGLFAGVSVSRRPVVLLPVPD